MKSAGNFSRLWTKVSHDLALGSNTTTLPTRLIGFEISERSRGHGYARQACLALAPFIRTFYKSVAITCDPDNMASRRILERLGAEFVDEVAVPSRDPHYLRGSRAKRRYLWRV
ncbi:MAG: GNAT family N-acetyltransferase [Steroidobacteraceae bacterium]